MDYLRSCFTTEMYLWGKDRPPVPVRWFFAAPAAKMFPHATTFGSVDWSMDKGYHDVDDLLGLRGAYSKGEDLVGYAGTNFHGPPEAYIDGGTDETPELLTAEDGSLPECARLPGLYSAVGGQAQGGTAAQGGGQVLAGDGGQAQGGAAAQAGGQVLAGDGGQAQGGVAAQSGAVTVTPSRVTQEVVEVLRAGSPAARVTQEVVEVLRSGSPAARVTQEAVEVLRT